MAGFLESITGGQAASATVAAALIAASTSAVVTLLVQLIGFGANKRLEKLKSELVEQIESTKAELSDLNASRNARRLYEEIEPLLFQLYEACEQSYFRVKSLCRSQRGGDLDSSKDSWLRPEGYYLFSTVYYLLLPIGIFRIIQKKMTFVDIYGDPGIALKYYLAKIYFFAFTDDFVVAGYDPVLPYEPDAENWETLRIEHPERVIRQAFVVGDVDAIADAMLHSEGGVLRVKTYGEFETAASLRGEQRAVFEEALGLFQNFESGQRPVLARVLLVLACLSDLIISSYETDPTPQEAERIVAEFVTSDKFGKGFAWDQELTPKERDFVRDYVVTRLGWIPTGAIRGFNS
ncbi:hypothetical protein OOJ09_23550 [Mesorhizobium qingshengii]|uniref:Uncharacterized protein n=1 Tax=Mesorhizobium qingshengii TaxID=1165689 RepID=A0ABT4R023_9HYPH|nr:hypothetical protein [Mesorhizobium qingshengii]MCZ8547176.1 hypothetical protein [Mesorhizobium qingshengii]